MNFCKKEIGILEKFSSLNNFRNIADNGKRLCEVREFEEPKVQEFINEANAFSAC